LSGKKATLKEIVIVIVHSRALKERVAANDLMKTNIRVNCRTFQCFLDTI